MPAWCSWKQNHVSAIGELATVMCLVDAGTICAPNKARIPSVLYTDWSLQQPPGKDSSVNCSEGSLQLPFTQCARSLESCKVIE